MEIDFSLLQHMYWEGKVTSPRPLHKLKKPLRYLMLPTQILSLEITQFIILSHILHIYNQNKEHKSGALMFLPYQEELQELHMNLNGKKFSLVRKLSVPDQVNHILHRNRINRFYPI
jgi:hypothetical protein